MLKASRCRSAQELSKEVICQRYAREGSGAEGLPPQDNNAVVKTWGEPRTEEKLLNHVDLVEKLGIVDLEKGVQVAGKLRCFPTCTCGVASQG